MTDVTNNKTLPQFETIHTQLDQSFYVPVTAAVPPKTILRYRNDKAAQAVGLAGLDEASWIAHFGQFTPFQGSFESPLALAYHGHQFGHYNPDIGDGRGFLFAQLRELQTGRLLDLGTKGTGQTPFSRQGDGCLTLKGAVREILATEMLEAIGVPTSKTFSVIETGRALMRHDEPSPTRSAMLVRLSHSHIRIGSFQRNLYQQRPDLNDALARHVVAHYYPDIDADQPLEDLIPDLLAALVDKVAVMAGGWMAAGFVHGVLNTDNFNLTGESFDYGPWRFLPTLDPNFTAAYFDQQSRYAYGRQPDAALWALCRFADCFVELIGKDKLEAALHPFFAKMEQAMIATMLRRLGVRPQKRHGETQQGADAMIHALLHAARESQVGFDQMFFDLYGGIKPQDPVYHSDNFAAYFKALADVDCKTMSRDHPYFREVSATMKDGSAKPVSLVIEEVEALWAPIAEQDDWQALEAKLAHIRSYGDMLARYDINGEDKPQLAKR